MEPGPERRERGALPTTFARVLRVLAFSLLAFVVLRSFVSEPEAPSSMPAFPEPGAGSLEAEHERMQELADKGVELLRFMRAGVVTQLNADGIFVSERWETLSGDRRAEVCAALRTEDREVRPVVDETTGRRLGYCDESARFAPDPGPPVPRPSSARSPAI